MHDSFLHRCFWHTSTKGENSRHTLSQGFKESRIQSLRDSRTGTNLKITYNTKQQQKHKTAVTPPDGKQGQQQQLRQRNNDKNKAMATKTNGNIRQRQLRKPPATKPTTTTTNCNRQTSATQHIRNNDQRQQTKNCNSQTTPTVAGILVASPPTPSHLQTKRTTTTTNQI